MEIRRIGILTLVILTALLLKSSAFAWEGLKAAEPPQQINFAFLHDQEVDQLEIYFMHPFNVLGLPDSPEEIKEVPNSRVFQENLVT